MSSAISLYTARVKNKQKQKLKEISFIHNQKFNGDQLCVSDTILGARTDMKKNMASSIPLRNRKRELHDFYTLRKGYSVIEAVTGITFI